MEKFIVLLPLIPLVAAIVTHLGSSKLGKQVVSISVRGGILNFLIAVVLLVLMLSGNLSGQVSLGPDWGILLADPLSILMALVIAGISAIVRLYSVRYMIEEPGYARFFVLLDLMTASLFIMVCAGDLISLLVAWHLIGVLLYFLLGYDTRSFSAFRYAFWTLFTYRIGDLAMLLAAGFLYHAYGTWSLPVIFAGLSENASEHVYFGFALPDIVGSLLAIAALARSAQFLLHTWLPYSMGGPTPVSALMHAGIVNAGGFLINRFAPVFVNTTDVLHWLFAIGLVTAVVGSILMLTQNDIKKALGYSTMGQMGFMIMECGVGAFSLAIYHLIAHGMFKGTLFLRAGSIINEARKEDGVPKEDLYTFVIERRPERKRQPWLLMAAITLIIPLVILVLAHWAVSQDYFQKQGALVLLFFGWVTGAQLIFATFRMGAQNIWRLISLIVFSFAIVVLGYSMVSHAFDLFLYPDPGFRSQIYAAADIDVFWFDVLVGLVAVITVIGWLARYYSEKHQSIMAKKIGKLWISVYAMISREFYLNDLYAWLARTILNTATKLNIWLRWR
ncbi:MAG: proton-conducting transporter membrane subunit [Gammaproteobacteria bacterium]|nr:proton-conducting transporter membrane subunit [Gammaproteobacteria bacterium]